eukprot:1137148-Pelagomonas_calceolata.AAC.8
MSLTPSGMECRFARDLESFFVELEQINTNVVISNDRLNGVHDAYKDTFMQVHQDKHREITPKQFPETCRKRLSHIVIMVPGTRERSEEG